MQLEVAALGDLHGAGQHAGRVGKQARHLVGGLDEELVGVEFEAIGVVDLGVGLHAEHHVVGVRVFAAKIMRVVGGDQRDFELALQPEEIVLDLALGFEALVLNFEIEVALAEDVLVLEGDGLGLVVTARGEFFAEFAGQAARGADQPLGVLRPGSAC